MTDDEDAASLGVAANTIRRAFSKELLKEGATDLVRDAANHICDSIRGTSLAVAIGAIEVMLITIARDTPDPEALIAMIAENCIRVMYHSNNEALH